MASTVLRSVGIVMCVAGVLLLVSGEASANLLVPFDLWASSEWAGVLYLFTVNLPIDMFAYSLSLALICLALGFRVGNVATERRAFMMSVIVACVLIAIAGAVIDFYLLFERGSDTHLYTAYDFRLDFVKTAAACLLVFASILLVSVLVVRTSWLAGLTIGLAVAVANLASWYSLTLDDGIAIEEAYWLSLIFLAALAVPMHVLVRWHSKREVPA